MEKVPYKLVVGDKEVEEGTVSVRRRGEGDIGSMSKDDFFALVKKEEADKIIFWGKKGKGLPKKGALLTKEKSEEIGG